MKPNLFHIKTPIFSLSVWQQYTQVFREGMYKGYSFFELRYEWAGITYEHSLCVALLGFGFTFYLHYGWLVKFRKYMESKYRV